jgi:tRNA-dihydrouridine synthase 3
LQLFSRYAPSRSGTHQGKVGGRTSNPLCVLDRCRTRFLIYDRPPISIDDDLAEGGNDTQGEVDTRSATNGDEPPGKKPRLSGAQKKKLARGAKQSGANKGRHFAKVRDELDVCWKFASGETCLNGPRYPFVLRTRHVVRPLPYSCRFSHDLPAYLKAKPKDLSWSAHPPLISSCAPFLPPHEARPSDLVPSVDLSTACPIFLEKGYCKHGFKCRFLGGHIRHTDSANGDVSALAILRDETVELSRIGQTKEVNAIDPGVLKPLRSRKVGSIDIP